MAEVCMRKTSILTTNRKPMQGEENKELEEKNEKFCSQKHCLSKLVEEDWQSGWKRKLRN